MQGNEGNGLSCQLAAYGELALYPSVLIGFVVGCEEVHAALVDSHALIAEGGEHEVHAGLTAVELVAHGNHVAALQGVFRLEEVEVFVGCRAENAEAGTAYVGIVPNKFCVQSAGGHVGSVAAEELRGKPPAPCGQIVLHADVVPRTVVLLHALPVEEVTVTEVEVRDERFFAQIPFQRAAGGHERRHAVEGEVVGIIFHRIAHSRAVGRVARTAGKPAFGTEQVGALLHVGSTTLFATAFPEHIGGVRAPKTDRNGIVFEQRPVVRARLCALHVHAGVEVERVAVNVLCLRYGRAEQRSGVPVIVEEERGADIVAVAEGLFVVRSQAAVERD